MTKNEFYWFNLPETIKSKMTISDTRAAEITCITQADFNALVASAKWHRLPELVQSLVDQLNTEADSGVELLADMKVTWFNLPSKVEIIYGVVQSGTLCT